MAEEICATGKWVDTRTGCVVDSEPAEGRLLVPPGGVITPDMRLAIERAEGAVPEGPVEDRQVVETVETATAPSDKETASVAPKRARG